MNEMESAREKKEFRVAIYLRLSDEDNDKVNKYENSESIKNQRNMLMEEISKRPNFMLVDEYCDENLSGAGTYRPEFNRMIKDCEDGKIDIVLTKSQSRFSRDMEVIEKYLHNKFLEWNIRFISLSDNADTDNDGNKKSRQINGLTNEWFLEDTSKNIRSALDTKMRHGEFISPFASFGYEVSKEDNNKLIIDPYASEVVKDIFNLYLRGFGFTAIAKYLNKKDIPSPSKYKHQKGIKLNIISSRPIDEIKWSTNAVKTILTNELYLGHLIQGKRTTTSYKNKRIKKKDKSKWIRRENTHEAIIDTDTFNKAKIAMKERTKPCKKNGTIHIFSGKVFCAECNHYMRKKNSSKHDYLVCSSNIDGYDNCKNKSSIRYDTLESIVLNAINKKLKLYYDKSLLKEELKNNKNNRFDSKIKSLLKQKTEIETKLYKIRFYLKSIYEDKVNGVITLEQFKCLISDYNKDESKTIKQIKQINEDINFIKLKKETTTNIKFLFERYKELKILDRCIIEEFIDRIYIEKINEETKTRNIKISWKFM